MAEGGSRPTCKNRKSVKWIKKQKMGRYADEEKVLHQEYKRRRAQGMVVDYEWLQGHMRFLVKASGKDPQQKFTATNCWTKNFMRRKGLSVQKKTGKKHRPAAELLPRVKNFHWYSIYKMANENP